MKLTLSAKRLTARRRGLGWERTPEELILGHRRADRRPKPQMDILVGTVSQRGLQVPHTQAAGVSSTWFRYIAVIHQETLSTIS